MRENETGPLGIIHGILYTDFCWEFLRKETILDRNAGVVDNIEIFDQEVLGSTHGLQSFWCFWGRLSSGTTSTGSQPWVPRVSIVRWNVLICLSLQTCRILVFSRSFYQLIIRELTICWLYCIACKCHHGLELEKCVSSQFFAAALNSYLILYRFAYSWEG